MSTRCTSTIKDINTPITIHIFSGIAIAIAIEIPTASDYLRHWKFH
ncbi:MAG: hypothetical protein R2865_14200 [Deinococcales bacterium]